MRIFLRHHRQTQNVQAWQLSTVRGPAPSQHPEATFTRLCSLNHLVGGHLQENGPRRATETKWRGVNEATGKVGNGRRLIAGNGLRPNQRPGCDAGSDRPVWRSARASVCRQSNLVAAQIRPRPQNHDQTETSSGRSRLWRWWSHPKCRCREWSPIASAIRHRSESTRSAICGHSRSNPGVKQPGTSGRVE